MRFATWPASGAAARSSRRGAERWPGALHRRIPGHGGRGLADLERPGLRRRERERRGLADDLAVVALLLRHLDRQVRRAVELGSEGEGTVEAAQVDVDQLEIAAARLLEEANLARAKTLRVGVQVSVEGLVAGVGARAAVPKEDDLRRVLVGCERG